MVKLDRLSNKRPGAIRSGLVLVAACLALVGVFAMAWSPAGFSGKIYAAPCEAGQDPSVDDCEIVELPQCDPTLEQCNGGPTCVGEDCSLVSRYLNPIIRFLAAAVGLVVLISIVVGGIEYSSSADDPQKVQKAKARIFNAILGLIAFLFLYAFLEWVIPGGLL